MDQQLAVKLRLHSILQLNWELNDTILKLYLPIVGRSIDDSISGREKYKKKK